LSAQVVFKWQWYDWEGTHLAENHHITGQKNWPSNQLLFVISRWASDETFWQCQLQHVDGISAIEFAMLGSCSPNIVLLCYKRYQKVLSSIKHKGTTKDKLFNDLGSIVYVRN